MLLQLKGKANELWETIVRLETEKYDLEERQKRQDYDVSTVCESANLWRGNVANFWFYRYYHK